MPFTYTGNDAAITDRTSVTVSNPIDADPPNAASVTTPLEKLANYCQRLIKKAGMLDLASSWTAAQAFAAGLTGTTAALSGAITGASVAVSGAVTGATATLSGALAAASAAITGAITGASIAVTGAVTSATVAATGAITGASAAVTGALTGATATLSGAISGATLALTASNPAITTGFTNTLTKANICKAWAEIELSGAGTISINRGFNIASIASVGNEIRLTYATAMAQTFNCVLATGNNGDFILICGSNTTALCGITGVRRLGAYAEWNLGGGDTCTFYVAVFALQ